MKGVERVQHCGLAIMVGILLCLMVFLPTRMGSTQVEYSPKPCQGNAGKRKPKSCDSSRWDVIASLNLFWVLTHWSKFFWYKRKWPAAAMDQSWYTMIESRRISSCCKALQGSNPFTLPFSDKRRPFRFCVFCRSSPTPADEPRSRGSITADALE